MMDWITAGRHRLALLLGCYFAIHVVARTWQSSSLSFDESEQAFLSQFLAWGYNSQPPLYTWLQTGLFEIFGYTVLPVAILKNGFLFLTYLLVFGAVVKATGDSRLAAIASLGMFTIPQIAFESHRDLSHTVAATFTTALLFYCVISLAKDRRRVWSLFWYVLIGIAVGIGALFKYNFLIVVIGFLVASASIRQYRRLVLDRGILISVSVAAAMVLPHAVWMLDHAQLASEKTITTLTTNQSEVWIENVASGFGSLGVSIFVCVGMTLVVFFALYVRPSSGQADPDTIRSACEHPGLLLERFLIVVIVVLALVVLTGQALEFKHRWLQPFVCLVPAYLTLKFGAQVVQRKTAMNIASCLTLLMMLVLLGAVVARPIVNGFRGNYCWLNIPYRQAAESIRDQYDAVPAGIVASNMRVAGNLRLHFPQARVVSWDFQTAEAMVAAASVPDGACILLVSDRDSPGARASLVDLARRTFGVHPDSAGPWRNIEVDYLYGTDGDRTRFCCSELRWPTDASTDAERAGGGDHKLATSSTASQHY
jgi:hypothetical protein